MLVFRTVPVVVVLLLVACGDTKKQSAASKDPESSPRTAEAQSPSEPGPKGQEGPRGMGITPAQEGSAQDAGVPPRDELPRALSSDPVYVGHYTILARDTVTGDLGVARVSNCPGSFGFTVAGDSHGLAATGGRGETVWAREAAAALRQGRSPEQVLAELPGDERHRRIRQLAVLPATGRGLVFSGDGVLSNAVSIVEDDVIIFTAVTVPQPVPESMLAAYRDSEGLPLAERLLVALDAGAAHVEQGGSKPGGLARVVPAVAAQLFVVRRNGGIDGQSDTLVDLRVDFDRDPLSRLKTAYSAYGMLVLGPRLLQLQRTIADTSSPPYQANRRWIERLRARSEIGSK